MSSVSVQYEGATMYSVEPTNITEAQVSNTYIIKEVVSDDVELKNFLFSLGCYSGESITLISKLAENYVITVKDARYSIDEELASAIKL